MRPEHALRHAGTRRSQRSGDYWKERIRCMPIPDEICQSCAHPGLQYLNYYVRPEVFALWAERAQQPIDQSINQPDAINLDRGSARPCSAILQERCHGYVHIVLSHAMPYPTHTRPRLSHAAQQITHMETRGAAARILLYREQGFLHRRNQGTLAPQISIGYVTDLQKEAFCFQPFIISTAAGQYIYVVRAD